MWLPDLCLRADLKCCEGVLRGSAAKLGKVAESRARTLQQRHVYVHVRRPIYAGNGLATVQVTAQGPRMLTVSSRYPTDKLMLCSFC